MSGSCSRVATSSCFGMNKQRGSVCLAVERHDSGDDTKLFVLNGILMNRTHTHTHKYTEGGRDFILIERLRESCFS